MVLVTIIILFKTWPTCRFSMVNHITFIFIKTMSHDLLVQMAYVRLHDIQKKTVSHQEPIIWSKQLPNFAVVDPGEGGGGGQSSRLWDKGGPGSKKFGLKIGGPPRSLPWIRPCFVPKSFLKYTGWWKCHDKSTLTLLSLGYCHLMICYSHQNLF